MTKIRELSASKLLDRLRGAIDRGNKMDANLCADEIEERLTTTVEGPNKQWQAKTALDRQGLRSLRLLRMPRQ